MTVVFYICFLFYRKKWTLNLRDQINSLLIPLLNWNFCTGSFDWVLIPGKISVVEALWPSDSWSSEGLLWFELLPHKKQVSWFEILLTPFCVEFVYFSVVRRVLSTFQNGVSVNVRGYLCWSCDRLTYPGQKKATDCKGCFIRRTPQAKTDVWREVGKKKMLHVENLKRKQTVPRVCVLITLRALITSVGLVQAQWFHP